MKGGKMLPSVLYTLNAKYGVIRNRAWDRMDLVVNQDSLSDFVWSWPILFPFLMQVSYIRQF